MLHTPATQADQLQLHTTRPARVQCRARTWRVLDWQHGGEGDTWRLARDAEMPRLIASPPDEVLALPPVVRRVSRRAWVRAALAHATVGAPAWWPASATRLPVAMVAWQFAPAMMILSGHHRRVLLADEVGMGKTVQAALLIHEIHAREPDATTLVVVPAGLVRQWTSELRVRARVEASVLDALTLRAEAAQPQRVVDAARSGSCWVISLDLLRQPDVIALLARTRWTLLVIDEAHACAPGTARLEAVSRVAAASVRVLLLTATPTAAGPAGADRLRAIGERPGESPMAVVRRDASLLARPRPHSCVLRVGLGDAHLSLCSRLDRFADRARRESGARGLLPALVLRRRASSCPAALVCSIERRLEVLGQSPPPTAVLPGLFDVPSSDDLDDEVMRIGAWSNDSEERVELEQLLLLARRLPPAGAKLQAVTRLVRRCAQPVVVFTAFLDTLRALVPLLRDHAVVIVHGAQPDALRVEALEAFTNGDARVLVTTDASAEGLNLHARCRLLVHAEVPPSRRVFEQRNGRLDRYGQSHRVHAVVMSSDTVEDDDALARMRARAEDDDAWRAGVVPVRCRRHVVAAHRLAMRSPGTGGGAGAAARLSEDGTLPVCALRPGRWRRLATRLGVPEGARVVWAATLRASGGPELSASGVPVFVASRFGPLLTPASVPSWPASLRGPVRRATRLVRRLEAWERGATLAAAREALDSEPDLFADAAGPAAVAPTARHAGQVWVTLEPAAVITSRESMPDVACGSCGTAVARLAGDTAR